MDALSTMDSFELCCEILNLKTLWATESGVAFSGDQRPGAAEPGVVYSWGSVVRDPKLSSPSMRPNRTGRYLCPADLCSSGSGPGFVQNAGRILLPRARRRSFQAHPGLGATPITQLD
jgi:hypothetical protein